MPPNRACSRTSSLAITAKIRDDDQQIQQSGDDQEGVAVFVGDRADVAGAVAERARDEIGGADTEVGDRGQRDQRVGEIERRQAPLDRETDREHQRQRHEDNQPLGPPSEPQMAGAGDRPRRQAQQHEATRLGFFSGGSAHGR